MKKAVSWLWGSSSERYWKKQAANALFDMRCAYIHTNLTNPWKSFFYEQTLIATLQKVQWDISQLSLLDKLHIKQYATSIEAFTLVGHLVSSDTALTILSWLVNLKTLKFEQTNGQLPAFDECTFDLPKITTIYFSGVHLIDRRVLHSISDSVQTLYIHQARSVTCDFLEGLQKKTAITSLSMTSCTLDTSALHLIPKQLHYLDLSNSGKNQDPKMLQLIGQNLTTFLCNGWNQCCDADLSSLPQTLQTLSIDHWNLSSHGVQELSKIELVHCSMRYCNISENSHLETLPKTLKTLDLSGNTLTTQALTFLQRLNALETLKIEAMKHLAPIGFFPHELRELSLAHSGRLEKSTLKQIKELKMLLTLNMRGCFLENQDLEELPEQLQFLDISECESITDTGVTFLNRLKNLNTLITDRCEQIRGSGLTSLSSSLQKLSCQGCHRFSGKCLTTMPKGLEELYINDCELVDIADTYDVPKSLQIYRLSTNLQTPSSTQLDSSWSKKGEHEITTALRNAL